LAIPTATAADCFPQRIASPTEPDGIRQRAQEVRMMPIEHVLAVVPVSDLERANAWYEALFGRPADNRPMPSLVEWQVTGAGWVQVTVDIDRAGSGLLNFAVDDLAATRDELATRGVDTAEIQPVSKGVELSATTDPDGNAITLIGNFRVKY
jgi:predicted enzyme related to lactoylglutathione lyase